MDNLKTVSMVAMFGDILCDNQTEKNNWKKRMINTVNGINFPDDWDELTENEKQLRLDNVIQVNMDNKQEKEIE